MGSFDRHGLGYHDVDGDDHTAILIGNMDATAEWSATRRLRGWERQHLALADGERLLDVGCGRGEAALTLATDLGPTGELVGVDSSAAMLDVARRRRTDVPCSTTFVLGDARSLDDPDQSFDVVRCERTLQWLPEPEHIVAELARVLRIGGRLSLIDTEWSTLHLDVGNPHITETVREAFRTERNRPSNIGGRLGELATSAGCRVSAETSETQIWTEWSPDESPAPDGCFSMTSLADDLVETGHLEPTEAAEFVHEIHRAARQRHFRMSLTMHAVIAVRV